MFSEGYFRGVGVPGAGRGPLDDPPSDLATPLNTVGYGLYHMLCMKNRETPDPAPGKEQVVAQPGSSERARPCPGKADRSARRRAVSGGGRVLGAGAVLGLALLVGGCAYFNVFYHAKKYYAEGERARIAAEKKGQISTNNESFKKCIDKCKKLIEEYPDSKWQDDAHLLMAKAAYGRQDYLFAKSTLQRFPEKFPNSDLLPEALYWTGLTYYASEDYMEATATWHDLLKRFPQYDDRESVEFYLAEASWKGDKAEVAVAAFEDFLRRYPDGKRSTEARLDLSQLLMDEKQYDKAAAILGFVTNKGKQEEDRLKAQMLWGEALEAQHKDDDALNLYTNLELQLDSNVMKGRMDPQLRDQARQAEADRREAARQDSLLFAGIQQDSTSTMQGYVENPGNAGDNPLAGNPGTPKVNPAAAQTNVPPQANVRRNVNDPRQRQLGQAMLREGSVLVRLEKPLDAIEVFQQVVSEFSGTAIAAEAQYRIGYVYEVFLQDFRRAQEEYGKVANHGQSAFRDAAAERAKNLSTVRNIMASAPGDSLSEAKAAAAEAQFMRAELYLFQQENPERALEEYHAIETEFAGTEHAAKAGLAIAWVDRNSLGDSTAAMAKYAEVAEQYPNTEYGRRAEVVLHGPEKEPDPQEYAGPTIDQLRDPENLALLSPEAEAALSKMDEDVAQAQAQREAQREAQQKAKEEATAAGPLPPKPEEDGSVSLSDVVSATPGMRTAAPGTGAVPAPGSQGVRDPGMRGGAAPGTETASAPNKAVPTAGPGVPTGTETTTGPTTPTETAAGPEMPAAKTSAASGPETPSTGTPSTSGPGIAVPGTGTPSTSGPGVPVPGAKPPLPAPKQTARDTDTATATSTPPAATPPGTGLPGGPETPGRQPAVKPAGNTQALPPDEPFFWERKGSGPNPLIPVAEAPATKTTATSAPGKNGKNSKDAKNVKDAKDADGKNGKSAADTDTVPGYLMRVPRGLYLDPLAVPEAEPSKETKTEDGRDAKDGKTTKDAKTTKDGKTTKDDKAAKTNGSKSTRTAKDGAKDTKGTSSPPDTTKHGEDP